MPVGLCQQQEADLHAVRTVSGMRATSDFRHTDLTCCIIPAFPPVSRQG